MKTLILLVLLSLVTTLNYSGKWICEDESFSFSLTLYQTDTIVTGFHLSVMQNGNRIDGGDEDIPYRYNKKRYTDCYGAK